MSSNENLPLWSLGLNVKNPEKIIEHADGSLLFNLGGFSKLPADQVQHSVRNLIRTRLQNGPVKADDSAEQIITSFQDDLDAPELCLGNIDKIRAAMAGYTVGTVDYRFVNYIPPPYPRFEPELQRNIARYGNVELAVVEGYLRDSAEAKSALSAVISINGNEDAMYARGVRAHHLDTSDQAWNIRKLMTNAGFYASSDLEEAWISLSDWAERYIEGMKASYLAAYSAALPFAFGTMRRLWEIDGTRINSVRHPSLFELYPWMGGRDILVLSPMAELIEHQASSNQLWDLYTDYQIPRYEIRAISAAVSTWPNSPHSSWSKTFEDMCKKVDAAYALRPFDIFMASCGCYGIPICDYVRLKHGCSTLYIGNILHALFGISQNATSNFAKARRKESSWIKGKLGDVANMHRIDGGRYV